MPKVDVVSVAGTIAFAPAGPYAAAKHAQLAFSRSLAATLGSEGIRVHTVLPGFVETEGFTPRSNLRSGLMRRFVIDADQVAEAIVKAVERGKREVTVPWFPYRLVSVFRRSSHGARPPRRKLRVPAGHPGLGRYDGPGLRATYQPTSTS
jgi:short-subunit dehydrogenase